MAYFVPVFGCKKNKIRLHKIGPLRYQYPRVIVVFVSCKNRVVLVSELAL